MNIKTEVAGRRVGLAWFSPDCKHFSKAKGGKPVEKKIRGLAWVALKWAGLVKPRVLMLENVIEFVTWSRLKNGRPDPAYRGETFKRWVRQLRKLGYAVEWREIRACDYGAPTIRQRLFIIARCDGLPIVWPEQTHAPEGDLFSTPYRTAAECIDWSIPCPSIFLTREEGRAVKAKRPLAAASLRRIARGVKRYVIDAARPFIVPVAHYDGTDRTLSIDAPLTTITANPKGGSHALVVPQLAKLSPDHAEECAVFLSSYYGLKGQGDARATGLDSPIPTQPTENRHALIATHLMKLRGTCRDGQPMTEPAATISAQGTHIAEVRALLVKYYGTDQDPRLDEPMHTLTTKDRIGVVTVLSEDYVIVDIGMRMLTARELFRAQGFRDSYIINRGRDPQTGKVIKLSKKAQVRMCGNSVSPPPAIALVRAQFQRPQMAAAA